jgi:hypothetical protein
VRLLLAVIVGGAIASLTAVLLTACAIRRGGVRGFFRAWRLFEVRIEIDASPIGTGTARAPSPSDDHVVPNLH